MTYMVERLAELQKHLRHLRELQPRVQSAADLERDLSLHNDVLFSLLTIAQLLVDLAGELCSRHGLRFNDYTQAVRNLSSIPEFPPDLVERLVPVPGFRNVLVHEYISFDLERAVIALRAIDPIEQFVDIVARIEATG